MALTPAGGDLGRTSDLYIYGTCTTTCTVFRIYRRRLFLQSASNDVRYHVYCDEQSSIPASGDAAPSDYIEYDAGDSGTTIESPNGRIPFRVAIWGAAGGETIRAEAKA